MFAKIFVASYIALNIIFFIWVYIKNIRNNSFPELEENNNSPRGLDQRQLFLWRVIRLLRWLAVVCVALLILAVIFEVFSRSL